MPQIMHPRGSGGSLQFCIRVTSVVVVDTPTLHYAKRTPCRRAWALRRLSRAKRLARQSSWLSCLQCRHAHRSAIRLGRRPSSWPGARPSASARLISSVRRRASAATRPNGASSAVASSSTARIAASKAATGRPPLSITSRRCDVARTSGSTGPIFGRFASAITPRGYGDWRAKGEARERAAAPNRACRFENAVAKSQRFRANLT